ncbi:MAG: HupE/UreJ family protein [Proteobacteria bacterium]|nr:HupE/UreJ family protein [Pseudomonadota bacterium]
MKVFGAAGLATLATPAWAHHMMGGKLPSTFGEGLLSGLGHPVIGADHLAFILAVGIASAVLPAVGYRLIAAFIAASTAGVLMHLASIGIPLAEAMVASSVIIAGALIATGDSSRRATTWIALAVVAGLLHGYAFGESIFGAERGVIGAYLIGLAAISAFVATGAMLATRVLLATAPGEAGVRAVGVVVSIVGAVMLMVGLVA